MCYICNECNECFEEPKIQVVGKRVLEEKEVCPSCESDDIEWNYEEEDEEEF